MENQYGIRERDLTFGKWVGYLSWPEPVLQPMVGRLLSYNADEDRIVVIHEDVVTVTRFSLIMDVN